MCSGEDRALISIHVAAMFANGSGRNEHCLQKTFHRCLLPSFGSFGLVVSEKKIFRNRPIRKKNCLWWPCLLMDRDEMITLYRGREVMAKIHIAFGKMREKKQRYMCISITNAVFFYFNAYICNSIQIYIYRYNCILNTYIYIQTRILFLLTVQILKNRPIRNKNCLWLPGLLMNRDEISNLYRGHSIDASYRVSVNLAEEFQRRRLKCEKLTDERRRTTSDGKSSLCLWQGELKMSPVQQELLTRPVYISPTMVYCGFEKLILQFSVQYFVSHWLSFCHL